MQLLVEPATEVPGFNQAEDDWETVYARMDQYLQLLGIHDKVARIQAVCTILDQAVHRADFESSRSLLDLAVEEMDSSMEEWMERIAPGKAADRGRLPASQHIAVLAGELPSSSWQFHFLQDGPFPDEFVTSFRQTKLRAHPSLQRAAMIPQPLDLGPLNTLAALTRSPFFKFATGAAWLFGLIFAMVFFATHL